VQEATRLEVRSQRDRFQATLVVKDGIGDSDRVSVYQKHTEVRDALRSEWITQAPLAKIQMEPARRLSTTIMPLGRAAHFAG
jgi:hypothetical protein